jgi:hypothetical protein
LFIEPCVPPLVAQGLWNEVMRCSVDLDGQLGAGAVEVQDVRPGRMLTPKVLRELAVTQLTPKDQLWQGHFSP